MLVVENGALYYSVNAELWMSGFQVALNFQVALIMVLQNKKTATAQGYRFIAAAALIGLQVAKGQSSGVFDFF